MSAKDSWTPYGLEAIRIRHIWRRRLLAALAVLALAGAWSLMLQETTTSQYDILVNGKRANGIQIDVPEPVEDKPVTVRIDPGRVTRADTGGQASSEIVQRSDAPVASRAPALNWNYYVIRFAPFGLLAFAAAVLVKRRGKHDEVNYGIYKGAMPLEMITASAAEEVFTTRWAKTSLFGKRSADHLPLEVLAARGLVERVPQDGDREADA